MNIVEAFEAMNRGATVVDPMGGVWATTSGGRDYTIQWSERSKWTNERDVPTRLIPGEWRQLLSDSEVFPSLRRGCLLKTASWSLARIRLNPKNEHLEFRRNPNEDWIFWADAQSLMSYKWVIAEDPEGEAE